MTLVAMLSKRKAWNQVPLGGYAQYAHVFRAAKQCVSLQQHIKVLLQALTVHCLWTFFKNTPKR